MGRLKLYSVRENALEEVIFELTLGKMNRYLQGQKSKGR